MNQATDSKPATSKQEKSLPLHIAMSLTNGGRSLNAIWYLNLPPTQKLILQFIGSEMNFTGTFEEPLKISRKTMAVFIGISKDTLDKAIKALIEAGYLIKTANIDVHECNEASEYALTDKLFDDYAQFLEERWAQRNLSPQSANYKRFIGMIGDSANGGGGRNLRPGVAVNYGPFSPPSSSPEIPDPQSEEKAEKPCHNDDADLIQASISPMSLGKKSASSLGKRVPSPVKYAMQYAKSMEFLYSKDRKGGYDWEITNPAAEKFIRDHGKEAVQVLLNWAQEQTEMHGRVKVRADMFDFVWARFEEDQHTWSIDV